MRLNRLNTTIVINFITIIILTFGIISARKKCNLLLRNTHNTEINYQNLLNSFFNQISSARISGLDEVIYQDTKGQKEKLTKVAKDSEGLLVLHVNPRNCFSCLKLEVKHIREIQSKVGITKLIVLSSFPDLGTHLMFKRENLLNCEVGNINTDNSFSLINDFERPYFFFIHGNGMIDNLFIPDSNLESLTIIYLNNIIKILNHEN